MEENQKGTPTLMINPSLVQDLLTKDLEQVISSLSADSSDWKALSFLKKALDSHVSDIHIEPHSAQRFLLRRRIDGYLHDMGREDSFLDQDAVLILKQLSKLSPAAAQVPQQGLFYVQNHSRSVRVEFSTLPLVSGEKMVIRFIPGKLDAFNLRMLGLTQEQSLMIEEKIQKPYGMIFVTGPAQSGVTSTVYSILKRRMSPKVNILTIEDPVEQVIHGINQVQVCADIGLTCAAGLRAFLRQDPDVIYSGAEHDEETLGICIRAALTGRLIISCLHAWDAPSALARILELGGQIPHLLAESLNLIVNQRLIRRLCVNCKQPHELDDSGRRDFGISAPVIYRANPGGCESCRGMGYRGQTGIFDVLFVDDNICSAIRMRVDGAEIKKMVEFQPRLTLYQAGMGKVNEGVTSIEEVLRVQF
ncbi:MAG TPA: type II secretion system protein GspE [Candidatus Omnitrophica bacterium]|nr:type II secretion system protein GspE [Candidatus Omnitrophota bacterium]